MLLLTIPIEQALPEPLSIAYASINHLPDDGTGIVSAC